MSPLLRTKFCKINAENCPFLAERLNIVLLPTVIMTKDNFVNDRIEGFDELGGRDDFGIEVLERRLAKNTTIDFEEPPVKSLTKKVAKGTKSNPNGKAIYASSSNRRGDASDDDDNDESDDDY